MSIHQTWNGVEEGWLVVSTNHDRTLCLFNAAASSWMMTLTGKKATGKICIGDVTMQDMRRLKV